MLTLLNIRVLETSTAAIFLSNGHSLYAPLYLWWMSCLISFEWDRSTCQERVESDKMQNKKLLFQCDSKPQPWDLKSDAPPSEPIGFRWKLYYLNYLYTYMFFQYQCIHWYKFENDEMERILSWKCTVLCYILEYSYIELIAKRSTTPVFAFNMHILLDLVFAFWKQTQDLCVSLLFVRHSYIPICHTKQYIYKTKYAPLHYSRTYTNEYIHVYIGIGSTC